MRRLGEMKMKKKKCAVFVLAFISLISLASKEIIKKSSALYVKADSGYLEKDTIMPDGYYMNAETSKCSNGTLSWDKLRDSVSLKTSGPSKCSIYLDKQENEAYYSSLSLALKDFSLGSTDNADASIENAEVSLNLALNKIKLLKDVVLKENLEISKNLFMNINGFKIAFKPHENIDWFIDIKPGAKLEIYAEKKNSTIEYISQDNTPIFLLEDMSILNITGGQFNLDYTGESSYSVIKDLRENKASVTFDKTKVTINGENIDLFNSDKPLSLVLNDLKISFETEKDSALINSPASDTSIDLKNVNILYSEKSDANTKGYLINAPKGQLKLENVGMLLESEAKVNNINKIVISDIAIKDVDIKCKLNSETSILDIKNHGEISDLNMICTNTRDYTGILYSGNKPLILNSSTFDLRGSSTGVRSLSSNVLLQDTIINAGVNIKNVSDDKN